MDALPGFKVNLSIDCDPMETRCHCHGTDRWHLRVQCCASVWIATVITWKPAVVVMVMVDDLYRFKVMWIFGGIVCDPMVTSCHRHGDYLKGFKVISPSGLNDCVSWKPKVITMVPTLDLWILKFKAISSFCGLWMFYHGNWLRVGVWKLSEWFWCDFRLLCIVERKEEAFRKVICAMYLDSKFPPHRMEGRKRKCRLEMFHKRVLECAGKEKKCFLLSEVLCLLEK